MPHTNLAPTSGLSRKKHPALLVVALLLVIGLLGVIALGSVKKTIESNK